MILCNPSTDAANNMIERVQRKFFPAAVFIHKSPHSPHDYIPIRIVLTLDTLLIFKS